MLPRTVRLMVTRAYLHSPFWFCTAELEPSSSFRSPSPSQVGLLSGCLVSSLHKVKLSDNKGYQDLCCKIPHKLTGGLRTRLVHLRRSECQNRGSLSNPIYTVRDATGVRNLLLEVECR